MSDRVTPDVPASAYRELEGQHVKVLRALTAAAGAAGGRKPTPDAGDAQATARAEGWLAGQRNTIDLLQAALRDEQLGATAAWLQLVYQGARNA